MDSPLTQQLRPDTFEPKIVQLYLHIFNVLPNDETLEDPTPSEGFWREFFLLKPDKQRLYEILEPITASELLHMHLQTQTFFRRTINEAGSGTIPRNENALENLAGFLSAVFTKRYTNPSTDIIEVLAGLDAIDKLISDLVNGLEAIIRSSSSLHFRTKAVSTATAMVSGAFQTSLVSYFMHRDLFPATTRYIIDDPDSSLQAFILLGLLASYNKFEAQNVYQNRLEDFVNEETIKILVHSFAECCRRIRDEYVAVQDDSPGTWTWNSTLNYVGLRSMSPDAKKPPPPSEEEAKAFLNALPSQECCSMLAAYTFVQANKIFAADLLSLAESTGRESSFAAFLSSTSYLAHHAHRGVRPSHYATLSLLAIRVMTEDPLLVKRLCSQESKTVVRLCRQRPPHLPLVTSSRVPATAILDICTDTLSHNLKKKLDVQLYTLCLGIMLRLFTHMDQTKTRLPYHWAYVWGSLMSLIRFLTQYASDLNYLRGMRDELCTTLANLTAFCLAKGDGFLPDPSSYDDLFYKLVEGHDTLPKFKQAYSEKSTGQDNFSRAMDALIAVSSHYHELLKAQRGRKLHQSPTAVHKVIKEGYETLNLETSEDFDTWDKWREASWKAELKKMIRTAVEDARLLALR